MTPEIAYKKRQEFFKKYGGPLGIVKALGRMLIPKKEFDEFMEAEDFLGIGS